MMEFNHLTVLIVSELLLGLSLLSGILVSLSLIRKHNMHKAARQLAVRIQQARPSRAERLKQKLSDDYAYPEAMLDPTVVDLQQAEQRLYQNSINGLLKPHPHCLQQLDRDVEHLVLAYQGLKPPGGEVDSATPTNPSVEAEREELVRLQAENQRLSDELKVTMDTMGRMLNEYASVLSSEMNGQQGSDDSAASSEQDELLELEPEGEAQAESNPQRPAKRDAGPHQSGLTPAPAKTLAIDETLADKDPGTSAATKGSDQDDFDEVLEVTDDFSESAMPVREQPTDTPSRPPPDVLVDELEQVDVLSPAVDSGDQRGAGQTESLDEEWAKLLAEDPNTPESANLSAKAKKA